MQEFRPKRFEVLPVVIKNLLIINSIVFLAQLAFDGIGPQGGLTPGVGRIMDNFALHYIQSPLYKPWQFLTHMFMHGSLSHLLFNMFALWMFGNVLENIWGPKRFLIFYLVSGFGAAALHMLTLYFQFHPVVEAYNQLALHPDYNHFSAFIKEFGKANGQDRSLELMQVWNSFNTDAAFKNEFLTKVGRQIDYVISEPTIGASGAVFGCLAAFGMMFPNSYLYLYFFIPIKTKWFVIGYILLELVLSFSTSAGNSIAHMAHVGGAITGAILVWFWKRKNPRVRNF